MSEIRHVADADFEEEVLKSDIPIIVDFWAEWCGPCKMIGPILEDLAPEYDGRAKILKLNVDENRQTAMKYGIMSIPTMLFFKDGSVIEQLVGIPTPPKDPKEEINRRKPGSVHVSRDTSVEGITTSD